MIDIPIGKTYQGCVCIENDSGCEDCDFELTEECPNMACLAIHREDKKEVVFIKEEKKNAERNN